MSNKISGYISIIKENYNAAKNSSIAEPQICAGAIRTALEAAVKLLWLKKYNKEPVWIINGKEEFNLFNAVKDPRFSSLFNEIIISDIHVIRKMCNDVLHAKIPFTISVAQELLNRLEKCVEAIQEAIEEDVITKQNISIGSKTNNANVIVESISNSDVYQEPSFDYLIVKTSAKVIQERGSLYEATRLAWRAGERITNYKYVISVISGVVQEVYVVNKWNIIQSGSNAGRYEFNGEIASLEEARALKGKKIPEKYRKVGMASPVVYKKLTD